ncbi:AmpG family muropeptide MFS transporter [Sphingomonas sp. MMS24-J13]|uniref:AmpG family muropeptide MFS transporter n=1 Tax=Sphingomonas sp. MMS24-J13 TaxID=3238686 RepID=UPI00384E8B01
MAEKLGGVRLFRRALGNRKTALMLAFGFSSGLPYTLLIGTLNAWLGASKVSLATIGVLSWIGLAYGFKFLWSPLVDQWRPPALARFGRRRSWILLCQFVLTACFVALATTDPAVAIGAVAGLAVIAAFFSATQDTAIDAWRVDIADEVATVEILSSIYQLGFRISSLIGGAFSLMLAARIGWQAVYAVMGCLMGMTVLATLLAPDTPAPEEGRAPLAGFAVPSPRARLIGLLIVGIGWAGAIATLGWYMVTVLGTHAPGVKPMSAGDFTKYYGPWIVVATIVVPAVVAAWLNGQAIDAAPNGPRVADRLYRALVLPLGELTGRLGWGSIIVLGLILTYRLCESIWGPFAYPFYLDYMHYTNDEVAFASKIFGIVMIMIGIALGGFLFATIGRMPTLLIGAVITAVGNLLFADLAAGAPYIDAFSHMFGIDRLTAAMGFDVRMNRLLLAICGENICSGLAGGAFVAYLSSITSKQHSAVQYALLSSLTLLIGSLGRAAFGEGLESYGYATMFRFAALIGILGIGFTLLEWVRISRAPQVREPGHTGSAG